MSLRANCEKFDHWGTTLIKTNKQTNNISYWYFLYIAWALGVSRISNGFPKDDILF